MSVLLTIILSTLTLASVVSAQTLTDPTSCLKGLGVAEGQMPTIEQLQKCAPQPPAGSLSAPSAPSSPATVSTTAVSTQSSSCPNLTRTLSKGSRGTDVTELQNFLIGKGYLESGNSTGYFGSLTESAVQKFQCAQSVVCSGTPASTGYGLVGAKTRAAIKASCGGTTTTSSTNTTSSNTSNSSQSLIDQLNAQIKQLQERLAALGNTNSTQTSQSTQTTQSTQSTQTTAQTNASNASCSVNGQTIAHGKSGTLYSTASLFSQDSPALCSSVAQSRSCSNGILGGSNTYHYGSCTDYTSLQKLFHGQLYVSYAPGSEWVTAYFSSSPCTTYRLEWGDGETSIKEATRGPDQCTTSDVFTDQVSHDYSASGTYEVNIRRVESGYGSVWYVPKKKVSVPVTIGGSIGSTVTVSSETTSSSSNTSSSAAGGSTSSHSSSTSGSSTCTPKQLPSAAAQLAVKFDQYDQEYNNGWGYTQYNNLSGQLSNNETYFISGYLLMFEATNDAKYIRKAIEHSEKMLAQRDDKIGVYNYLGQLTPTWSRSDYSIESRGPFAHLIDVGVITAPIAATAAMIKQTPCLQQLKMSDGRTYLSLASSLAASVAETVQYHHQHWHSGTNGGYTLGWWTTPEGVSFPQFSLPAGYPPPINYQTAMGETLAHMYAATGDTSYRDRAIALGYMLLYELQYTPATDAYWFYYWPKMSYYPDEYTYNDNNPEDFGHVSTTMQFMRAMTKYGIGVFDSQNSTRLAHAFTRNFYQPSKGGYVMGMDGTGIEVSGKSASWPYISGFFAFLEQWDSNTIPAVEYGLFTQKNIGSVTPPSHGMHSLAAYIYYTSN